MKHKRRGDSAEYSLSESQVQALLAACTDIDERVTIGCQLFLGLRVSELVHMRADWITEEGDFKIPSQMACNCAECVRSRDGMWKPKTKAGARTLPVPQRLRKDLAEMLKVKPYGMGISRVGLYYRTKTVLIHAKIKFPGLASNTGFPHCLRATSAMMLAERGMTEIALCYFMGWADLKVASHYIKVAKAKNLAMKQAKEIFG